MCSPVDIRPASHRHRAPGGTAAATSAEWRARRGHRSYALAMTARPPRRTRRPVWPTVVLTLVVLGGAACGSSGASTTTTTTAVDPAARTALSEGAAAARTDAAGTEWLCRPGHLPDPCVTDLTATVVPVTGAPTRQHASVAADPPVDCFYVYPTVSRQSGVTADLHVDPAETAVARTQASRFSQVCRVWAPMYRQITVKGLTAGARTVSAAVTAYEGVQAAWQDYLAHDNHGRGVILIGHSQGASVLIGLLRRQIDDVPATRKLLVSAMILGGNVTVPVGKTVGGSFQHVPACTSDAQTGCVIAYSSFDQAPPANSLFGRPGQGVSLLSGATSTAGLQVLCTNPADLAGNAATPLTPYFPTKTLLSGLGALGGLTPPDVPTPWVTEPQLYSGQCLSQGGATWLQVNAPITPSDTRQVVSQTLGPTWGLHLVDVNIALGDLVDVARSEAAAYTAGS